MKNQKKYHIVGTFPKFNRKIEERGKIDNYLKFAHKVSQVYFQTTTFSVSSPVYFS
jgi:hypothetical protein